MNVILDFIEQNYGYSTKEIAERVKIGRPTVSKYIRELERKNLIKNLSDRKNKNKWVPNKDNEIIVTRKNIYKFKESYFRLLKSSLKHPQFTDIAYKLKPETGTWDDGLHQGKIIGKMYEEINNAEQIYSQKKTLVKKTHGAFRELVNMKLFDEKKKSISLYDNGLSGSIPAETLPIRSDSLIKDYAPTQLESNIQMSKTLAELTLSNISQIKKLQDQYCFHLKNSGHLMLTYWPILIFLLLEYSITLKSISKWPKIIDKDLLIELNKFAYKQFMEIKSKLLDFLSQSNNQNIDIETVMQNIDPLHEEEYYVKMFYDYSCLDMKPIIKDIFNSLIKIREKDIEYSEQRELDQIYNSSNELLDFLKQLP